MHYFADLRCKTDWPVIIYLLLAALLEQRSKIGSSPVSWNLTSVKRLSENLDIKVPKVTKTTVNKGLFDMALKNKVFLG